MSFSSMWWFLWSSASHAGVEIGRETCRNRRERCWWGKGVWNYESVHGGGARLGAHLVENWLSGVLCRSTGIPVLSGDGCSWYGVATGPRCTPRMGSVSGLRKAWHGPCSSASAASWRASEHGAGQLSRAGRCWAGGTASGSVCSLRRGAGAAAATRTVAGAGRASRGRARPSTRLERNSASHADENVNRFMGVDVERSAKRLGERQRGRRGQAKQRTFVISERDTDLWVPAHRDGWPVRDSNDGDNDGESEKEAGRLDRPLPTAILPSTILGWSSLTVSRVQTPRPDRATTLNWIAHCASTHIVATGPTKLSARPPVTDVWDGTGSQFPRPRVQAPVLADCSVAQPPVRV